jgi:hypothetical protein
LPKRSPRNTTVCGYPTCIRLQVIGYYLKHAEEFAEYLETRAREEERLLASHPEWSPKGLRERSLARNAR